MNDTELDFNGALSALMEWIDRPARIEVAGPDEHGGLVLSAEGVFTAQWDAGVMEENMGEPGAIFRLAGTEVSLFVIESDFRKAWRREDGTVLLWVGGAEVRVTNVFIDPDAPATDLRHYKAFGGDGVDPNEE